MRSASSNRELRLRGAKIGFPRSDPIIQRASDGPVDCPTTVAGGHGREDQGGGVAGRTAWPPWPVEAALGGGSLHPRRDAWFRGAEIAERTADPSDCACTADRQPALLKCGLSAFAVLAATAPQAECLFETEHERVTDLRALTGGTARSLRAAPTTRLSRANSTCRPGRWPPVTGPSPSPRC